MSNPIEVGLELMEKAFRLADARAQAAEARLAAAERVLRELVDDCIPGSQSPRQEVYDRAVAFLGSEKAYSGGTSTDHVVPAEGSGQEMLALPPNMSHRRDTSDPNRLADETSGPDDLDAYIERRKRTDLNSVVLSEEKE